MTDQYNIFTEYDRTLCRALYDGHRHTVISIAEILNVHPKYVFIAVCDLMGFKGPGIGTREVDSMLTGVNG